MKQKKAPNAYARGPNLFNFVVELGAPAALCDLPHVQDEFTAMQVPWCASLALAWATYGRLLRGLGSLGRLGSLDGCLLRRLVDLVGDGMEFDEHAHWVLVWLEYPSERVSVAEYLVENADACGAVLQQERLGWRHCVK